MLVEDNGPTGRFREPAHQRVLHFGAVAAPHSCLFSAFRIGAHGFRQSRATLKHDTFFGIVFAVKPVKPDCNLARSAKLGDLAQRFVTAASAAPSESAPHDSWRPGRTTTSKRNQSVTV
jgi:hypothetical protein